jgi:hypothetical protein
MQPARRRRRLILLSEGKTFPFYDFPAIWRKFLVVADFLRRFSSFNVARDKDYLMLHFLSVSRVDTRQCTSYISGSYTKLYIDPNRYTYMKINV